MDNWYHVEALGTKETFCLSVGVWTEYKHEEYSPRKKVVQPISINKTKAASQPVFFFFSFFFFFFFFFFFSLIILYCYLHHHLFTDLFLSTTWMDATHAIEPSLSSLSFFLSFLLFSSSFFTTAPTYRENEGEEKEREK